jgi:activator of 2-hydroxyglutaryl-CoA dehydratase
MIKMAKVTKMAKTKTTLSFERSILQKLREMSASKGLDMGSFVTHLLLMEEERVKANERMEKMYTQMFPNGINDIATLVKLIQGENKEGE